MDTVKCDICKVELEDTKLPEVLEDPICPGCFEEFSGLLDDDDRGPDTSW